MLLIWKNENCRKRKVEKEIQDPSHIISLTVEPLKFMALQPSVR